jgi:DNA repair protein RecO (recombination protein O)
MSGLSKESAAIVLDCYDHGESDRIVTFFCQDIGRMTGIAKGAKRSQKRFVNKLELFSLLSVRYTESYTSNLAFIVEAELVESFLRLRQNMSLYVAATVIRELTLAATREMEGDDGIFSLLRWGLQSLDAGRGGINALTVLALYQIKFFERIGYRPHLGSCLRCNQPLAADQDYGFDSRRGGLVCKGCQGEGNGGIVTHLSQGTIKILRSAQDQPLDRLHRLQLSALGAREALALLHYYGRHLLQREICSLKLLSDADWNYVTIQLNAGKVR